eukprot:Gb_21158 [translate_table: standard]
MESNKDEALRCISISTAAFKAGDKARAQRFLSKAKRLYPDLNVDDFQVALCEDVGKQGTTNGQPIDNVYRGESKTNVMGNVSPKNSDGYSCRRRNSSVTLEQSEIVCRIRKTKDYYEMLGLARDCSEGEVRKAYRKLSLKVHPDKNKLPGAEEAFKSVSKAFNCLSNSELRKKYDNQGIDDTSDYSNEQHMRQYKSYDFSDDMYEPSEAFTNFFFGMNQPTAGFRSSHFFRTCRRGGEAGGASVDRTRVLHFVGLVQLLAILVLVLLNFMPSSKPSYSLKREASYRYEHFTSNHGVSFFVRNADFDQKYPPASYIRRSIETFVERDHREILAHNCRVEVGLRMWGRTEETPNCDALRQFTM